MERRDDRRPGRPVGDRDAAGRPGRPRVDGPQPPPGPVGLRRTSGSSPSPTRSPRRSSRGRRRPAPRASREPLAMIAEAELDAVVIAAPTTAHLPLALAAIERGHRGPRREAARGDGRRGDADRRRGAARAGVPGPGRPRRAVQPGRPRARPAARGGLAVDASTRSRAAAPARSRPGSATSA